MLLPDKTFKVSKNIWHFIFLYFQPYFSFQPVNTQSNSLLCVFCFDPIWDWGNRVVLFETDKKMHACWSIRTDFRNKPGELSINGKIFSGRWKPHVHFWNNLRAWTRITGFKESGYHARRCRMGSFVVMIPCRSSYYHNSSNRGEMLCTESFVVSINSLSSPLYG